MISLTIKNNDTGKMVLVYTKGNNTPLDLLTIDDLGLPKIATSDARRSYSIIDSLRKLMREEDLDTSRINIIVDENYNCTTNQCALNTMFRYLNKDLEQIDIIDRKVCFSNKRSA